MTETTKMIKAIANDSKVRIDRIVENYEQLEKENAELKADNSEWEKASDKWKSLYESTNNQLTKAKELLRRYVPYRQITDSKAYKDLAEEAEQFLSEVEK